eukprot:TRINITY_DN12501_c0_g1_i1.p1 TRINITY_DN12501_c0_g1~~TRINITY_DN12501_c0_g1_i1.p1  ORF type:complete len:254 (+),score=7.22 TRINITY_DN12501_c0_g1_i1:33-794(+)
MALVNAQNDGSFALQYRIKNNLKVSQFVFRFASFNQQHIIYITQHCCYLCLICCQSMSNYVSPVMFPAKLAADTQDKPPVEITKIEDAIWYILNYKLTRVASFFLNHVNQAVQNGVQTYAQNWIKPSGPRRPGEGVEDCEQGIMNAGFYEGGITITFTQLLAGFLIGPNGTSIRDLMRRTNCHVKSYTEDIVLGRPVRTRVFILQAEEEQSVLLCLDVILAAVGRYKELAEGLYQGKYVNLNLFAAVSWWHAS